MSHCFLPNVNSVGIICVQMQTKENYCHLAGETLITKQHIILDVSNAGIGETPVGQHNLIQSGLKDVFVPSLLTPSAEKTYQISTKTHK